MSPRKVSLAQIMIAFLVFLFLSFPTSASEDLTYQYIRGHLATTQALPYKEYAGFPLCSDILDRRTTENNFLAYLLAGEFLTEAQIDTNQQAAGWNKIRDKSRRGKAIETQRERILNAFRTFASTREFLRDRVSEFDIELEAKGKAADGLPLVKVTGRVPSREQIRQQGGARQSHVQFLQREEPMGGWCLQANTRVITLDCRLSGKSVAVNTDRELQDTDLLIGHHEIQYIYAHEWVLGSTVMFLPPPYGRDCWSRVQYNSGGMLETWKGERYVGIKYQPSRGPAATVFSTPDHRVAGQDPRTGRVSWYEAQDSTVNEGMRLHSGDDGEFCTVLSRPKDFNPQNKFWMRIAARSDWFTETKYNLFLPESFSYYVAGESAGTGGDTVGGAESVERRRILVNALPVEH